MSAFATRVLLVWGVSGCLLAGCAPQKPDAQKFRIGEQGLSESAAADGEADKLLASLTVASVGSVEISGLEVKQALGQLPVPERYYYNNPEKMALFTQNYALVLVYAWQALRAGMASDPYTRYLWEEALASEYRKAYLDARVDPSRFTDQEVEAWAARNADLMKAGLGQQAETPEQKAAFARSQLAEEKRQELWDAHLQQVAKELGFPLPVLKRESPGGPGVPVAMSKPN